MSSIRASTTYKKNEGTLFVHENGSSVSWTPLSPPGAPSQLIIATSQIINLQNSPATSPRIALKIVVQPAGASEPVNHTFNFTSTIAARKELEAIVSALKPILTAARGNTAPQPGASLEASDHDVVHASGSMTFAAAVNSVAGAEGWYDDQRLKSDIELQQSLLKSDPALRERLDESLREKPDSITVKQFGSQFWAARLHLLRAHAIEKNQSQGTYNVLSEVKPKMVDGTTTLKLSKEQIQLIFNQHPLVKRVYNESVPRLNEQEFWARFFVSRLFKKLKGERITDSDSTDAVLDKYLDLEEDARSVANVDLHIPHFIDLEGNEQNHSQRKGNQPDIMMRPNVSEKVPILRVLNTMSEKMMAHVAPTDGEAHAPVGMDEDTFNELRLRDLHADEADDRLVLHVKTPGSLFGSRDAASQPESQEALTYAAQNPAQVIAHLRDDFATATVQRGAGGLDLASAIGAHSPSADGDDDSDSDDERLAATQLRLGSQTALTAATAQIQARVAAQRALDSAAASSTTLSADILASLTLTHSTTTEFLRYFWSLFLHSTASASKPDEELPALLATLSNSLTRIAAVANEAEKERQGKIGDLKRQAAESLKRTGKRRPVDKPKIGVGGREEVDAMVAPTVRAIAFAKERFEAVLREQMASVAGTGAAVGEAAVQGE